MAIYFRRLHVDSVLGATLTCLWIETWREVAKGLRRPIFFYSSSLRRTLKLHGDPNHHTPHGEILQIMREDFRDWLGETKYKYGLDTIPPSQFSNTDSNGLWEYSPFLCGVGLMESLEMAYSMGMLIWDRIPEVMMIVHLHNMLVKKGYLSRPIGLWGLLEEIFAEQFFQDGKVPDSNFSKASTSRVDATSTRLQRMQRRTMSRIAADSHDIHGMHDPSLNRFFNATPHLLLYRNAGYNPDRIPDKDVSIFSSLALMRLAQTKQVVDPATGTWRLEETDLVKRARKIGMSDEIMLGLHRNRQRLEKRSS